MDFRYVFVYAMTNVFCLCSSILIFPKLSYNVGSESEIKFFRRMLSCYMFFLALELIWVLAVGDILKLPPLIVGHIKITSTTFIPLMVYFWFQFAEIKFHSKFAENVPFRIATFIPIIVLIGLYILSLNNGICFSVAEDGSLIPGPLASLTGIVDNIYGISIIAHAAILLTSEKVPSRKKEYKAQIVFIVICTIGGITDALVQNTPIMPLAIALSFNYLFGNLQEVQIFNDALTSLHNRRHANHFLEEARTAASDDNPFFLFILDVDNFKHINDTMGHLEGDRALQAVAKALQVSSNLFNGFTARWGGDEFMILINSKDPQIPEKLIEALKTNLEQVAHSRSISYKLSVSIGYTRCTSTQRTTTELIYEADQMLYQNKNIAKNRIRQFPA